MIFSLYTGTSALIIYWINTEVRNLLVGCQSNQSAPGCSTCLSREGHTCEQISSAATWRGFSASGGWCQVKYTNTHPDKDKYEFRKKQIQIIKVQIQTNRNTNTWWMLQLNGFHWLLGSIHLSPSVHKSHIRSIFIGFYVSAVCSTILRVRLTVLASLVFSLTHVRCSEV